MTHNGMKFGNLTDWHTDPERESDGVPLDLGGGRALVVRRAGSRNRAFMAAVAAKDVSDTDAMVEIMARTVIAGWRGIKDEHGAPIDFSVQACIALFNFAPDIYEQAVRFATHRGNFAAEKLETEKAAVKKRSGGTRAQVHTRPS